MKKLIIYPLLPVIFACFIIIVSALSCSSGDDIYVIKDTIVVNSDTVIKETRKIVNPNLTYIVQLAAFKEQSYLDDFVKKAKEKLNTIPETIKSGNLIIVTVGKFKEAKAAQDYLTFVKSKGYQNAFIKSLD